MNKEILEITKEFHDTYEKLASEYTYETREDTKVFDINSNNGKLMYATVNEIVSPILKENKILRENAEHNDKVVDKVNWENMLLKKENQELKKQLEEINKFKFSYRKDETKIPPIIRKQKDVEIIKKLENQQKEFIEYLENMLDDENDIFSVVRVKDVLQKYKELIGDDK